MKKRELFSLMSGFEMVKGLRGIKFAYARLKNKKLISDEIKVFEDLLKPSDGFLEYDKKRIELCVKYSKKDEKGKSIIENNSYAGLTDNKEFEKELGQLKEEYKEVMDERLKLLEEYNKMLEEEIELNFHKILLEDIPTDITGQQLELLMPIIKEK